MLKACDARKRDNYTAQKHRMRDEHTIKVFWHNAPLKDTQTDET